LSTDRIRVDLPSSAETITFDASIEDVQVGSSGTGEAAAYRFDLKLRETPESAAIRGHDRAAETQEAPKSSVSGPHRYSRAEIVDENPDEPLDLSRVTVSGDSAVWATALKQLKAPQAARAAAPPEPPLTPTERATVEAILVNLRLDALINQLEFSGQIRRSEVENTFLELVKERFVAEASPLVGERVAKRTERELLG
jgi:hypothetical protein